MSFGIAEKDRKNFCAYKGLAPQGVKEKNPPTIDLPIIKFLFFPYG